MKIKVNLQITGTIDIPDELVENKIQSPLEQITFEGDTAIIPDTVKEQVARRFKGLCTYPEGCDKPIMSRGLCRMHYQRERKKRLGL